MKEVNPQIYQILDAKGKPIRMIGIGRQIPIRMMISLNGLKTISSLSSLSIK
jgi:hypothetical protein